MELEWRISIVPSVVRKNIQESSHEVQVLSCDVGNLKYWAYSVTDELSGRVDALLPILDKGWHLAGSRASHNLGDLCNCLLQDVGRANVNLGHDNHDGHVERKGDSQMLFAHSDQSVVRSNHEQTVIRAAG